MSNTEGQLGTVLDRLDRLLADERRRTDDDRRRLEWMHHRNASVLARIEWRLTAVETQLARRLSPDKVLKLLSGIGLPIAVLIWTGSLDAAFRVLSAML